MLDEVKIEISVKNNKGKIKGKPINFLKVFIIVFILLTLIIIFFGVIHKPKLTQKKFENELNDSLSMYSNDYRFITFFDCGLRDIKTLEFKRKISDNR